MRVLVFAVALVGCSPKDQCPEVTPGQLATAPKLLSETGLFLPGASEMLGPGVRAYKPRFELWSDGAVKRRWIRLPEGTRIDSSDMDFWKFPTGTRLWKEFTRDGVRVETRLLEKRSDADDDWLLVAYAWNEDGTDATQLPEGASRAHGTAHDIPAASQCLGCHGGTPSRVLGFSAIQLGATTQQLFDEGLLTQAPPSLELPGDEVAQAALGYLHANCSHCHNQRRPQSTGPERCWNPEKGFDFMLRVDSLGSVAQTNAVKSVNSFGGPDWKEIVGRAGKLPSQGGMPPLAKSVVDQAGLEKLEAFIATQ